MLTLAVLFGGQSHEHPVSLMSATSVLNNLDKKYDVYMVGITSGGNWYHYSGEIAKIESGDWEKDENNEEVVLSSSPAHHGFIELKQHSIKKIDVLFPVLHGRGGEDGSIQGICQLAGIPCVSCSLISCALAIDKEYTHIVCENAGVKMAKYLVYHHDDHPSYEVMIQEVKDKFGFPCYVKPTKEGSSFGAHKIKDENDFIGYVEDAFSYDDKILLEEFIDGNEVGCGVLGKNETGEVYEVVVETEMYGYEEKYNGYKTNIYYPAKNLSKEERDEVNRLGVKVARALGCDCLARVDFFASSKGFIFNEANLIPGFTSHSLYPAMFKAAGKSYTSLLNELIDVALKVKR